MTKYAATALLTLVAAACSDGPDAPAEDPALARLRTATAPFQTIAAASAAGWSEKVTECMADARLGGMGVHYADLARFDATLDPTRPEILVYASVEGVTKLVAVEFAVPLAAWTSATPPTLFGQPFHVNQQFGLWVLHVWQGQENPSGLFADWNPTVRCS